MAKFAVFLLLAAGLVGLAFLVTERLATGDTYSPGSSLRMDREGTSVFYDALAAGGTGVSRNYQQPDTLNLEHTTILYLNLRQGVAEDSDYAAFEKLAAAGNRIVVALDAPTFSLVTDSRYKGPGLGRKTWNIRLRKTKVTASDDNDGSDDPWPLYFEHDEEWDGGFDRDGHEVAISRRFGDGTIAFIAASDRFLNGALRDQRDLALLTWTIDGSHRIVFDEVHLGSSERGTVMGLIGHLRLGGALAVLIFAGLLFYWQASAPFPPPAPDAPDDFTLPADGSGAILVNLMERRIAPSALMSECCSRWLHDCGRRAGSDRAGEVRRIAEGNASITRKWEEIRCVLRGTRPE